MTEADSTLNDSPDPSRLLTCLITVPFSYTPFYVTYLSEHH